MDDAIIDLDAFNQARVRLQSLMDDDPVKAIEEARSLPSDTPVKGLLYSSLKASVLIDAGLSARNKQSIEEGIDLFRRLLSEFPEEAGLHYNLANGLMALATNNPTQAVPGIWTQLPSAAKVGAIFKKQYRQKAMLQSFPRRSPILAMP